MDFIPVRMVAVKSFDYDQERRRPGDEFDCHPEHARLLKIVGNVRDPDPIVEPEPPEPAAVEPPTKRRYQRRDMRASAA